MYLKNFLLFSLIFIPGLILAQIYPYPYQVGHTRLKSIDTEHFRIIFNTSSSEKAFEVAQYAESELSSLEEYYGEFALPDLIRNQKIRVIISSDYQQGNAFASTFIYPTIHLYSSIPPLLSESYSFQGTDYLRSIFRHELAHIVSISIHQDPSKNPFINHVNYLVNPVAVFAPRSFLESTAVARESDFGYGRRNDPYTRHLMRRTLLDDKFPTFARQSGASTYFNTGHYPYTYGTLFSQYLDDIDPQIHLNFFKYSGRWQIPSIALWNASQIKQKDLYQGFKDSLYPQFSYETNSNFLLSLSDRRIHSLRRIKDKIYYYNDQNNTLYAFNLKTKKNQFIMFGNSTWEKIDISDDETRFLISGTSSRINKKFTVILDRFGIRHSPVYKDFYDARFIYDSSKSNTTFFALNALNTYLELVEISSSNTNILYQGDRTITFSSPTSIDENYVYFLQNNKGSHQILRVNRSTKNYEGLDSKLTPFPRFLSRDGNTISVSYADGVKSFYKRAIISNQTLYKIQNNIKGEIFESADYEGEFYYLSSFAYSDNIMQYPTNKLEISQSPAIFKPQKNKLLPAPSYTGEIKRYNNSPDLAPMFWAPNISTTNAGIFTIITDSTGGNFLQVGLNFEYARGTAEFDFSWINSEFDTRIIARINNRYRQSSFILQLGEHLALNTLFGLSWSSGRTPLYGTTTFGINTSWIGRFTGNIGNYPLTWNNLAFQQLLINLVFNWNYTVSEGHFGFNRSINFRLNYIVDALHPQWQRIEGQVNLSPPVIPVTFSIYAGYDTSQISIFGLSALGSTLFGGFREYSTLNIFSKTVNFNQIRLMLYNWQIQNGLGWGEFFINNWSFWTGYRLAYFGEHNPLLQSIYTQTQFDFAILGQNLPLSLLLELNYAFNTDKIGFNVSFSASLPI